MATPPILTLRDIALTFGGRGLFTDCSLSVYARDRICLVGRNGCGKSTLLKIIAGVVQPDGGSRWVQPGTRVAYLAQEPDFSGFASARAAVLAELTEDEVLLEYRADLLLEAVKVDADAVPSQLSGGQLRRIALARALVSEPDILLLDEPTNHLDIAMIDWLESELSGFSGAIVTISHDRAFLNNLSDRLFWLERGRLRSHDEGFAKFDEWSAMILEQEATEVAKLDKLIAEETTWSRQGISARRTRNQGRLRRLADLRQQRRDVVQVKGQAKLSIDAGETSGKRVIEAFNISKRFGDLTIADDFSLKILRGDRIALVGPNGVGKSTLVKMLVGELAPDSGSVKTGSNLTLTYLDQGRDKLDPDKSLWETLADVGGDQILVQDQPKHVVTYLREFLFEDRQARQPVGALSGGERNRLLLAKTLANATNLLVLDEPTNDLDMDTLDLLQEVLDEYEGTLLLVSHDRDFIDRLATMTLWFDGDGKITAYAGGYHDAQNQRVLSGDDQAKSTSGRRRGSVKSVKAPEPKPAAPARKKLTYAQEIRLKKLPDEIDRLGADCERLEAEMADPALYDKGADAIAKTAAALDAAKDALEAAEMEWLELEELAGG